jgi:hypothetical protein
VIEVTEEMLAAFLAAWDHENRVIADCAGEYVEAGARDCAGLTAVLAIVERDELPAASRAGYEAAIAALRGVEQRTGSPAARWAADYLAADPDKLAPGTAASTPQHHPADDSSPRMTGAPACEHGYSTRDVGGIPVHIGTGKLCGGGDPNTATKESPEHACN